LPEEDPMSFVTTSCPECGEVEIPLDTVILRVCEDNDSASCALLCPQCGARFTKPVDDGMSVLLVTFGVNIEPWQRPAEVDERPIFDTPISYEELESFADAIHATDDVMPFVMEGLS
jgi:hypothetical protein